MTHDKFGPFADVRFIGLLMIATVLNGIALATWPWLTSSIMVIAAVISYALAETRTGGTSQ